MNQMSPNRLIIWTHYLYLNDVIERFVSTATSSTSQAVGRSFNFLQKQANHRSAKKKTFHCSLAHMAAF